MLGGNLPDNRELENRLFSNEEVLRVNQEGAHPRQLYKQDGGMVWVSNAADGGMYAALVNISDAAKEVSLDFTKVGMKGKVFVRDLWKRSDLGEFKKKYAVNIPPHGSVLLKLTAH